MGYYVQLESSTVVIPKVALEEAYKKMCALNTTHHNEKRGGSWGPNGREAKWFSWMDENYPETCKDAKAIIDDLGFETQYDDEGNLEVYGYGSKTGQEDLFFESIADLIPAGQQIEWSGEDGARWAWKFNGKKMKQVQARIVYDEE